MMANVTRDTPLVDATGKINPIIVFAVEKTPFGSFLTDAMSFYNRVWLVELTLQAKYEKCRNDNYDYCFTNQSTIANIRTCLNTRRSLCVAP
jgi:hypothetical protein